MELDKDQQNQSAEESLLTALDLRAIELRFEGCTADEIVNGLVKNFPEVKPYKPQTVRNWFSKNGRLRSFYESYAKEQTVERKALALSVYEANLERNVKALLGIAHNVKTPAVVRVMALKELINRQLGEPKKVVENTVKDPAREILDELGIKPYERPRPSETN